MQGQKMPDGRNSGKVFDSKLHNKKAKRHAEGSFSHDLLLRGVKMLNLLLVAVPFAACWFLYYRNRVQMGLGLPLDEILVVMFLMLYFVFGRVYDAFMLSLKRISEMAFGQLLGIIMADGFMYIILWILCGRFPNILPALLALICQIFISLAWCTFAHKWYFKRYGGLKTAVIYDIRSGMEKLVEQYGLSRKFKIQFSCTVQECIEKDMQQLQGLDAVFLYGVHSHDRNIILKYCIANRITTYMIPRVGDVILSGAQRMHMFHLPILRAARYNPNPEYLFLKRAIDILISTFMLVVTSPVTLVSMIAIKAYDGGPVFYRQVRLTKDGKHFSILKFRSMRVDAEKDGVARLSMGEKDHRITPVGRFIRKYRIDEIPQFINILKGEMSLVGPRPERPEIAAEYEKEMPEFALRLQAKAGLTGYAQVYGKYNTLPYDKLQMDLMYIAKPSILNDLHIIFATVMILFVKDSTEGYHKENPAAVASENAKKAG